MTGCQLAFRVAGALVALAFLAVFGGFPRPAAFVIFALYGVAWIAIGNGLEWHALATLATWGMTLVIQGPNTGTPKLFTRSSTNSLRPPTAPTIT
jgi:hypothetical protein